MIRDARVLQDEFIPREVEHRDQEMNTLTGALEPVARNEPAETALLFGPSGTGKTCLARFALGRLREAVIDLNYQYVNCWRDYTRFRALHRILEAIGKATDIHRQSTPTDALLERLEEYDGPEFVVILDEVDQIQDDDLLYDLYRTRNLSMILIANREEELFARLDNRLVSRLHASRRVRFEKYELDELVSILEDRVRWGLEEGVLEREQLETIADAAAGDARIGIGILRSAARQAEETDVETIDDGLIQDAIPQGKREVKQKSVEQLTPHQRVLYEIIRKHDSLKPPDLYEKYRERVEDPRSNRSVRNYLSKLAHYNLIEKQGDGRGRTYSFPA